MKERTTIPDKYIHMIWRLAECCLEDCTTDGQERETEVPPTFYEEAGEPCCNECGAVMEYVRTEIGPLPEDETCEDCGDIVPEDQGRPYKYEPNVWLCDRCHDNRMEEDE